MRFILTTPDRMPDDKAVYFFEPSYNPEQNYWLNKDAVSGVVQAHSASKFTFTDATNGQSTEIVLPRTPTAVHHVLTQLGYA